MSSRSRYTNPIENLRSYIMMKGGIQLDERISDLEWVQDKLKAADNLAHEVENIIFPAPEDAELAAKVGNALRAYKSF